MHRRFGLRRSVQDGTAVVTVSGDVGPEGAAKLGYAIVAAVSAPAVSQVVVDLAAVESIDEHGLEVLVRGQRTAMQHGCTLQIASPSPALIHAAMNGLRATENLRELVRDALRLFPRTDQAG